MAKRTPKYTDGRKWNGGRRKWSGRKSKEVRKEYCKFLMHKALVLENRHGQMRRVRVPVAELMLDAFFGKAMTGDVRSAKLYWDMVYGPTLPPGPKGEYRVQENWFTKPLKKLMLRHAEQEQGVLTENGRIVGVIQKRRIIIRL